MLCIWLAEHTALSFGRYRQGQFIELPAGAYLYTGSAMGLKGSTTLSHRLLRHATRSEGNPPHKIMPALAAALEATGDQPYLPMRKKLHWHIDHLLDLPSAKITGVIALRTRQRIDLEARLASNLANLPQTRVISPGLGASDHAGNTHLVWASAEPEWWRSLPQLCIDAMNFEIEPDRG